MAKQKLETLDNTNLDSNIMEMSDEDFMKMNFNDLEPSTPEEVLEDDSEAELLGDYEGGLIESEEDSDENLDFEENNTDTSDESDESDFDDEETNDSDDETEQDSEDDTDEPSDESDPAEEADEADTTDTDGIDYKAEYERLLAPFKANNTELSVSSVDDAITLMQRGANYTAKMQQLAPARRTMQMLENNGLLDENRLNMLIDINSGNVEAIKALIKEKGIDFDSVDGRYDDGEKTTYTPNDYRVTESEVALTDTLKEIRTLPHYDQVISTVNNVWDAQSKNAVRANPSLLSELRQHMETGLYQEASTVLQRERMLNKVPANVSDADAYFYIADSLVKAKQEAAAANQAPKSQTPVAEKQRDTKRKKAAPTKQKRAPKQSQIGEDIWKMSDEEFMKQTSHLFE